MKQHLIPSLIQGVSQQSAQLRRDAQCEEQINCSNTVVNGAEARVGVRTIKYKAGADVSSAFFHSFRHGTLEQYIVAVLNGDLKVYNLLSGDEATVTFPDGKAYLNLSGGALPEDSFTAVSVDDYTLIGNKTKVMAMDGTSLSTARPKEACFYFKAGAYKTKYSVAINWSSTVYKWTYETPDNSVAANAPYIATEQIASTFYRAMTGVVGTSGATGGGIVGGTYAGDPFSGGVGSGTTPSGNPTMASLGFSVEIDGNCIRIFRNDNAAFGISVSDGQGGKQLIAFTDFIENFSDLPRFCFAGYVCRVAGESKTKDDDYYVQFQGSTGSGGVWKEVVKPGVVQSVDATTMPYTLQNTGVNTFVFKKSSWSKRISGDGVITSPDPSFIGDTLEELNYDRTRLLFLCENSGVWSKGRKNIFTFFPDTAQTALDTDPIDQEPSYTTTALLKRFTAAGGAHIYWADVVQFLIDTKQDTFKNTTAELVPITNYEFTPKLKPVAAGGLLFWTVDHGSFTTVRDLVFEKGSPGLDNTTNAHAPRYIPGGARHHAVTDTLTAYMITCEVLNETYLYQWLYTQQGRAQQALSKWVFPTSSNIRWFGFDRQMLRMLIQRPGGLIIGELDMSFLGNKVASLARFRLDQSVTEAQCSISYNAGTGISTITTPYPMNADGTVDNIKCILTADGGDRIRGTIFKTLTVTSTEVTVVGDLTGKSFMLGYKIESSRQFSEFFERDQNNTPLAVAGITIERIVIFHGPSGYYVIEVENADGTVGETVFEGRTTNDPTPAGDGIATTDGFIAAPVHQDSRAVKITLKNDSPYPSSWNAAQYFYIAAPPLP